MNAAEKYETLVARLREWSKETAELEHVVLSDYAQGRADQVESILSFVDDLDCGATFVDARCRWCEATHPVTTEGRFRPHRSPSTQDCYGGGRSPDVYFRKAEYARHVRDLATNRTAVWAAYTTGGVEIGRWCEQQGYAWGHQLASIGYRDWRKCVTEGITR